MEGLMTELSVQDLLFYLLGGAALVFAMGVLLFKNPIYSALSLAMSMVSIGGLFYTLNAYFVAGVQIIVYAGAVMVLFVMVLMLFNLSEEYSAFSKGAVSGALKLVSVGLFLGLLTGAIQLASSSKFQPVSYSVEKVTESTKVLANLIFKDYLFGFEAIGALLLIIAIGAVVLSRVQGGTHAE